MFLRTKISHRFSGEYISNHFLKLCWKLSWYLFTMLSLWQTVFLQGFCLLFLMSMTVVWAQRSSSVLCILILGQSLWIWVQNHCCSFSAPSTSGCSLHRCFLILLRREVSCSERRRTYRGPIVGNHSFMMSYENDHWYRFNLALHNHPSLKN